jgi:hypothetical protein
MTLYISDCFCFLFLSSTTTNTQLFTMLVFIQPKCIKYQHTYPGTTLLGAYYCVLFKSDKFHTVLRRLSSTTQADGRPVSPLSDEFDTNDNDEDDLGFSRRIRVAIRRLSINTTHARTGGGGSGPGRGENPYVDGDGIGFQDYNSDQRHSSSVISNDDERRLSMMSNVTDGDDNKHIVVVAGDMKRNSSAETEDVTLYSPRSIEGTCSGGGGVDCE